MRTTAAPSLHGSPADGLAMGAPLGVAHDRDGIADALSGGAEGRRDREGQRPAAAPARSMVQRGLSNVAAMTTPRVYLLIMSAAAARFLGAEEFGRQRFIVFAPASLVVRPDCAGRAV